MSQRTNAANNGGTSTALHHHQRSGVSSLNVFVAADLWGSKVNLSLSVPKALPSSSSYPLVSGGSPTSPRRQQQQANLSAMTSSSHSSSRGITWPSFVDGIECLFYAEAIARRPLVRPHQHADPMVAGNHHDGDGGGVIRGGATTPRRRGTAYSSHTSPAAVRQKSAAVSLGGGNAVRQQEKRALLLQQQQQHQRMHVCDVPTFVAESLWLLVHVCGEAPRWEHLTSLEGLYNNCQLFVFQPEGSLIAGVEAVGQMPSPADRRASMLAHIQSQYYTTTAPKVAGGRPSSSSVGSAAWRGAGVAGSGGGSSYAASTASRRGYESASSSAIHTAAANRSHSSSRLSASTAAAKKHNALSAHHQQPVLNAHVPPMFLHLHDAATACYLALVRAQLKGSGVTTVLLRDVLEGVVLGFTAAASSLNATADLLTSTAATSASSRGAVSGIVPRLFFEEVAACESPSSGAADIAVLMRGLRAIAVVSDALGSGGVIGGGRGDVNHLPDDERCDGGSTPSSYHRHCESPLCARKRADAEEEARRSKARAYAAERNRFIKLDDWLVLCEEQPDFLASVAERLFALPAVTQQGLPRHIAEYYVAKARGGGRQHTDTDGGRGPINSSSASLSALSQSARDEALPLPFQQLSVTLPFVLEFLLVKAMRRCEYEGQQHQLDGGDDSEGSPLLVGGRVGTTNVAGRLPLTAAASRSPRAEWDGYEENEEGLNYDGAAAASEGEMDRYQTEMMLRDGTLMEIYQVNGNGVSSTLPSTAAATTAAAHDRYSARLGDERGEGSSPMASPPYQQHRRTSRSPSLLRRGEDGSYPAVSPYPLGGGGPFFSSSTKAARPLFNNYAAMGKAVVNGRSTTTPRRGNAASNM